MKILLVLLSAAVFVHETFPKDINSKNLTCDELKNVFIGSLFYYLSKPQNYSDINFYLGTKSNINDLKIGKNDWSALQSDYFNPLKKTHFIIHGYLSHYREQWIKDLKNKLLQTGKANVILVDWSKGSHRWNYVNSVQITEQVTRELIRLLEDLKNEVNKVYKTTKGPWNKLYLIGHSLGAHISGQVGHLLKADDFYKIERITALDPAQPCFTHVDPSYKIDKNDAEFVDVIHTQTGSGQGINGFGLKESIGHIDFYVNGGVIQPACEGSSKWNTELNRMVCSHKLACNYFIESIANSKSNDCKFVGHSWNRTYSDALRIFNETEKGKSCSTCPEMGINAPKSITGTFLVITATKAPHCKLKDTDTTKLQNALKRLISSENLLQNLTPEDFFEMHHLLTY